MTLDEMIAWLADEACYRLASAKGGWAMSSEEAREDAATLLAIENALRAVRDGVVV
jgi:hypothetical protein